MPANTTRSVLACSFPNWYPSFKSVTIKSEIIPLPNDFIEYLHADGVFLRKESTLGQFSRGNLESDGSGDDDDSPASIFRRPTGSRSSSSNGAAANDDNDDNDDWERQSEDETDSEEQSVPTFPELEESIAAAIRRLGPVFPKLNWSAPRDASWIMPGGSLKCTDPDEVILLLKSSDFIVHDMCYALPECQDFAGHESDSPSPLPSFCLVLRQWKEMNRSMEFRCFVRNRTLIAVSQRDDSNCFEFLMSLKATILEQIESFFQTHIRDAFAEDNYCFDVYLDSARKRVWLLDFNPFNTADTLLFQSDELQSDDFPSPVLRVVEERTNIQPAEFGIHRVPADILTIQSQDDIQRFVDMFREGRLPDQDADD